MILFDSFFINFTLFFWLFLKTKFKTVKIGKILIVDYI